MPVYSKAKDLAGNKGAYDISEDLCSSPIPQHGCPFLPAEAFIYDGHGINIDESDANPVDHPAYKDIGIILGKQGHDAGKK